MKANAALGSLTNLRRHSAILSCHSLHLCGVLNDSLRGQKLEESRISFLSFHNTHLHNKCNFSVTNTHRIARSVPGYYRRAVESC